MIIKITRFSSLSVLLCPWQPRHWEQRRGAPPTTLFTASAIKPSQVKSQYFINTPVQHTDTDTSSLIFLQVVSHLSVCDAAGGTLGCVLLPGNRGLCLQTANGKSYHSCRYVTLRGRLSTLISFHTTKFHDFSKTLKNFTNSMTFPCLENLILKFHDFSRFSMTVGTLYSIVE